MSEPVRFLCFSDTHGALPSAGPSGIDIVLHAGDLYNRQSMLKNLQPTSQGLLVAQWAKDRKVFSVHGNHDCFDASGIFAATEEIDGRCVEAAPGLLLVGVGWHGELHYELPTEREMRCVCEQAYADYFRKSKAGDRVVLLTHYACWTPSVLDYGKPPKPRPDGWMFDSVAELARMVNALAVIQGHVHDLFGTVLRRPRETPNALLAFPGPRGGVLTIDKEIASFDFLPPPSLV
jgi:predicted phosphodiesterase